MAARADRSPRTHTRLVRLAKLLLPVAALALLSTIFLLARKVNPDDAIPFAEVDVSERAREQQLTMPRFTGVSTDGTTYDLSARTARPDADDPRRMTVDAMRLILDDGLGGTATVMSDSGQVDTAARTVMLDGDVRIETSSGYRLETGRLQGSLGRLEVVAPGEVTGDGPLGRLRAGAMTLDEGPEGAGRLLFTGGVDLLYVPPS
ncbi:LPS export ABC transporter periplasmic protein LptC [Jannaschia sp. S6380]|uniref:LPS export ABC transporter periplasmic protein LptC n=1 Tax=Jannaschia sp. S6380 TaxID=2926408 RepID=UPI001FF4B17D|nr:LPS export ABC transporter periplasmic protein LptC [Jannaschia sp. S6380]MCK0168539.1 LPS export ABC transporter periplasmic protein LptC [Jannaschia sp. S6380]